MTITYEPHEVIELIDWVWEHIDYVGGMSFLPAMDAKYAQMPYEEIDREKYEELAAKFPNIDFRNYIDMRKKIIRKRPRNWHV